MSESDELSYRLLGIVVGLLVFGFPATWILTVLSGWVLIPTIIVIVAIYVLGIIGIDVTAHNLKIAMKKEEKENKDG